MFKKLVNYFIVLITCFNLMTPSLAFSNKPCIFKTSLPVSMEKSKHQVISGPCWAFASMATLEICANKKNISTDGLSEKHLLKWVNQPKDYDGWHINIKNGIFNFSPAMAYFVSSNGPVLNRLCPYNINNNTYNKNKDNIEPCLSIFGIKYVDPNIESVKENIMKYGAVCAAFCNKFNSGHAVTIIGWNDESKKWLVKDSDSSYKDIYYLDYNNPNISLKHCYTFTDIESFDKNKKLYQHDIYNADENFSLKNNDLIAANAFEFGENESLDSIIFNTNSVNANYELFFAPVSNNGYPTTNLSYWISLSSGKVKQPGYNYIKLNKPQKIPKGKGAIILRLKENSKILSFNFKTKLYEGVGVGTENIVSSFMSRKMKPRASFVFNYSSCSFVDLYDISTKILHINDSPIFSIKAITKPSK